MILSAALLTSFYPDYLRMKNTQRDKVNSKTQYLASARSSVDAFLIDIE